MSLYKVLLRNKRRARILDSQNSRSFRRNGQPCGMRVLSIIKAVRLPQSNPSILLLPCHVRAEYFLSKLYSSRIFFPPEVGPLVFWACEAYHIFPFRHLWSMCRAPRRSFFRDPRFVRTDYIPGKILPRGRAKDNGKILIIKNLICVTFGGGKSFYLCFSFFYWILFLARFLDPTNESRGSNFPSIRIFMAVDLDSFRHLFVRDRINRQPTWHSFRDVSQSGCLE